MASVRHQREADAILDRLEAFSRTAGGPEVLGLMLGAVSAVMRAAPELRPVVAEALRQLYEETQL